MRVGFDIPTPDGLRDDDRIVVTPAAADPLTLNVMVNGLRVGYLQVHATVREDDVYGAQAYTITGTDLGFWRDTVTAVRTILTWLAGH